MKKHSKISNLNMFFLWDKEGFFNKHLFIKEGHQEKTKEKVPTFHKIIKDVVLT